MFIKLTLSCFLLLFSLTKANDLTKSKNNNALHSNTKKVSSLNIGSTSKKSSLFDKILKHHLNIKQHQEYTKIKNMHKISGIFINFQYPF